MDIQNLAIVAMGVAWTITYIALVYRGFKDKSYGMPLVPLALNLAWETTFSLIYPASSPSIVQTIISMIWMVSDVGIVATFFLYGYKYFERQYRLSRTEFHVFAMIAFVASFAAMILGAPFFAQFEIYFKHDLFESAKFIAHIQNTVISISFVAMFYTRRSSEGQSFTIAWSKWIGSSMTVGLTYVFIEHPDDLPFVAVFIATTFIFDVWYMVLIYRQLRRENINPWTRL